jgi:hypothetical protein
MNESQKQQKKLLVIIIKFEKTFIDLNEKYFSIDLMIDSFICV